MQYVYYPDKDDEYGTSWDHDVTVLWDCGFRIESDEPEAVQEDGGEVYRLVLVPRPEMNHELKAGAFV